ncbi:HMG-Y-related protein A-like [Aristolochia californica]|uniref:HMG-Y-related protein A-like n=1 Tax=Aristolochia californica TaxID=171875 RepID=UPI0035E28ED3
MMASSPPPAAAVPTHQVAHHPPYEQMIIKAIVDLNEKKGSSRKAIAKFIDASFSNLPHSHAALLSHHLRRLKKKGVLQMVKHSYKLPKNPPKNPNSLGQSRGRGRPPKPKPLIDPSAPKRGRGRPPKPKPEGLSGLPRRPRGRPRKDSFIIPATIATLAAVPIAGTASGITAAVPQSKIPLPVGESPRPRGRPRKVDRVDGNEKRSRGRPRKVGGPVVSSSPLVKRPRGRPRKVVAAAPAPVPPAEIAPALESASAPAPQAQ